MSKSKKLYNKDLAPTPSSQKKWGWFEILTYGQMMFKVYSDIL